MNTMSIAFTHLAASDRKASDLEGPGGIIAEGYHSRDRVSSRVSSRMELLAPHENFTHLAVGSERNASDLEGPGGIIAEGLSSDEMNDILIPG
jgi:hypothetical protein